MDLSFVPPWRLVALRGALAVLFALGAVVWPDASLAALAVAFGVYSLLDGIIAIALGARSHPRDVRWLLPLEGLLGLVIGPCALVWTGARPVFLTLAVGAWALTTGALEVTASVRLRRDIPGEVFLAIAGVSSMTLGCLLLMAPRLEAFLLVLLLGGYSLVFGAAMFMLAMSLRRRSRLFAGGPDVHAW